MQTQKKIANIPSSEGEHAKLGRDLVEGSTCRLELQVVVLVDVACIDSGLAGTLAAGAVASADQDVESVSLVGAEDKVLNGAVLLIGHVKDHLLGGNHIALNLVRGSAHNGGTVEQSSSLSDRLLNLNVAVSNLHQAQGSLGSEMGGADNIGSATDDGLGGVGVDDDGVSVGGHVSINVSAQFTIFS